VKRGGRIIAKPRAGVVRFGNRHSDPLDQRTALNSVEAQLELL
jgi:hypothetical protein